MPPSVTEVFDPDESAALRTSELVTNAAVHARTSIGLSMAVAQATLEVAVTDGNPRLPRPRMEPGPQPPPVNEPLWLNPDATKTASSASALASASIVARFTSCRAARTSRKPAAKSSVTATAEPSPLPPEFVPAARRLEVTNPPRPGAYPRRDPSRSRRSYPLGAETVARAAVWWRPSRSSLLRAVCFTAARVFGKNWSDGGEWTVVNIKGVIAD